MRHVVAAGLLLTALVLPATDAAAFVRTTTCTLTSGPFRCGPGEIPKPVVWPKLCVPYHINQNGPDDIAAAPSGNLSPSTQSAIMNSFEVWNEPVCSVLKFRFGGLTNDTRAEYVESRGESGNLNVVVWRDDTWPYASRVAYAITSVTFDPQNGLISDADIELNGQDHQFTNASTPQQTAVDIQNTLTHEAGHFLGLDHSDVGDSTMLGSAPLGELKKRTLHDDDIAGLCEAYPANVGENVDACTGEPGPVFRPAPGIEEDDGCCSTVAVGARTRASALLGVLALLGLVLRRRQ